MPPRFMGTPLAEADRTGLAVLEWAQATTRPRSNVRDAVGVPVFTGSPVIEQAGKCREGRVIGLADQYTVGVLWAGAGRPVPMRASTLRVTGPYVRPDCPDQRADWRLG